VIRACQRRPCLGRTTTLIVALVLAVSALVVPTVARGQAATTKPAAEVFPATIDTSIESKTIRREHKADARKTSESGEAVSEPAPSGQLSLTRVVMSLGIVLALIFGMKFFGQKYFGPKGMKSTGRTVETLWRAMIGPKQQVLLIKVGKRRVIVVGDSGGTLSALDQITDPDEIAELVGQLHTEKLGPAANAFGGIFGRSAEKFAAVTSSLSATRRAKDDAVEGDDVTAEDDAAAIVDKSVSATQRDLESLLAKVRGVSSRIG
jgi:flagellar biogenesis protein FliO